MEDSKKQDLFDKLTKKLAESFVDEVRGLDEKSLRDRVVTLSKELEDVRDEQKEDKTLNALKEQLKDLNGGYNDLKKEKTNRLKYLILTLENRGKL
jgi:hypothetical protein